MTTQTPPQTELATGPIAALIADINVACRRLASIRFETPDDVRAELLNNTYPAIVELAKQTAEVDEIVAEMSEQQGSFIEPELAAEIIAALALGTQLVEEIRKLKLDDVSKKRVAELCAAYEHAAEVASMSIASAANSDDEGDDDEVDDDEHEDLLETQGEENE
jgi:cytochrome c1